MTKNEPILEPKKTKSDDSQGRIRTKIPHEVLKKLREMPPELVKPDIREQVFTTQELKSLKKTNEKLLSDPTLAPFTGANRVLSPKQLMSYRESTARINVWDGAVRSGKTVSSILRFLKHVRFGPPGDMVVCGRTFITIKRNVLYTLQNVIGLPVSMSAQNTEMNIFNRTVHVVGANDERAEGKIRGATFAGAYVDEATLMPEGFFKMLLSRLSIPNAQLFATTNPDSPFHWLKREFIDKPDLDLKHFHFLLEDNQTLSSDYINALKKEYSGLWYKRYIDGEWCVAEGAIFDFFDEKLHVIDFPLSAATYYIVGVDYGTHNPCAFTLIGYNALSYPNIWIEKEYYWDSAARLRQKTDSEYADDLANFIKTYPIKMIYMDPSAISFRIECNKRGIGPLKEAENEVLDGIRFVSKLMINGTLKICKACKNLLQEMQTYSWDEKSRALGIDRPKKVNDHCLSGKMQIFTKEGNVNIEDLVGKSGFILSMKNNEPIWSIFINCRKTRSKQKVFKVTFDDGSFILATGDHRLLTPTGWVMVQSLTHGETAYKVTKELGKPRVLPR